jgi:hypothetical protein
MNEFFSGSGLITVGISGMAGDFNNDYVVDDADYTLWRSNFGQPAGTLMNDNSGAAVGTMQYVAWRSNSGPPAGSGSTLAGQAAVPEPSALILGLFGGMAISLIRSERRSAL